MRNLIDNKYLDVYRSYLVRDACYAGTEEFPVFQTSSKLPNKLITFSKALQTDDKDQWIVFYEDDYKFERIWNHPRKYLNFIKSFRGVISPDFSLYRDMPLCMQKWSTYKGRALAHWWQSNGIEVIPNIRYSDERSFEFCFDGIQKNQTIAISTHGCLKNQENRKYFTLGLEEALKRLSPKNLIIYGSFPAFLSSLEELKKTTVLQFDSEIATYHKAVIG